ncbi:hypothetical protein BpHYR1_018701 [Brachionus plicatilis]|uniref:Uncharacterized protein n=1 Tax=Brachionus plicatilis TaxID=10195 RepID=A0A3M7Q377_BRAPC|nr:hypothetical protein BpHYR1_018701 [Brachionus plicatilis]
MESLDVKNSSISSGNIIAKDQQHSEKIAKSEPGEQINIIKSYGCDTNRPFNTSDPLLASLNSRSDSFVKKKIEHFEKRSESLKESSNEVSSLKKSSISFVKRMTFVI